MSALSAASPPASGVRDVNFADPAFLANPWDDLIRLQDEAPVFWSQNQKGWIITRHEDVKACYADPRLTAARVDQLFRDMPPEVAAEASAVRKYTALIVNRLDDAEHLRIRTLMMKAFDRTSVKKIEGFIGEVADMVLDQCDKQREFDFNKVVGAVLPTTIMQRLFDLPDEYRGLLFKMASDFTSASSAAKMTPELLLQLNRSIVTLNEVFNALIAEREAKLGDDLISMLVHARDGLHRLSHDEVLAQLHGLVVAGAETTANSLGTQLVQIVRHPELRERLRDDPDSAFNVVTELLRYPGTVKCMTRFAKEDFELRGQLIRKGDLLWIMNFAANVDARVFPEPFKMDVDRPNLRDSMAFGPGLHHCIGHFLARTELAQFFTRCFKRFDVEVLQETFDMAPSYIFFGYRALNVRFAPR
ncbi:MAG TPA: cytochrome P450 [Caulobacterales bacterium]|nr:cytochrome P450 [Caulobacterales bacterium]